MFLFDITPKFDKWQYFLNVTCNVEIRCIPEVSPRPTRNLWTVHFT